jgi:hypothetical protein
LPVDDRHRNGFGRLASAPREDRSESGFGAATGTVNLAERKAGRGVAARGAEVLDCAAVTSPLQDDRFLLVEAVGRGGMGSVFRAFDRVRQRIVALKAQHDPMQAGPSHPLSVEFEAWAGLRHPNIVRAFEMNVARSGPLPRGTPYIVLEHAQGRPADRALPPGRAGEQVLTGFAAQALLALSHVHEAGWVHRDVKPANILVDFRGGHLRRIKLTDFGLAVPRGRAGPPGRISGSLCYVSPESLLGLPVDDRSDLYALGLVLFRLATGQLPGGGGEAMLRWHLSASPADARSARPGLSPRLTRFIRRLTARDPSERPRCAREALALLGAATQFRAEGRPAERDRSDRAALRLALDAARLGARRRYALPSQGPGAGALLREARVWAQVRGVDYQRLRVGDTSGCGVTDLVLRLLIDRGSRAARLCRSYGLRRWLPLVLVGGSPLRDREKKPERNGRGAPEIGRFILACSDEKTMVLRLDPARNPQPLALAVRRELLRATGTPRPPRPGRGGLLLLEQQPAEPPVSAATERGS